MFKLITIIVAIIAVILGFVINHYLQRVPDVPKLDYQRWWSDSVRPSVEDESIRPFKIEFNDTMVLDLKNRLKNRRPFRRPLDGMQSEYGINTIYLEKILDYWLKKYDFKGRAERLNSFPHYKTRIQGLDIHYIRAAPKKQRAKTVKVLPILLLHGWPSSSKEFDSIIPALTTPRSDYDFVFEVVAADLPGFGYSEGTNKPGLNPVQIGIIMRNLMKRLGFDKFYIQAGDWGAQAGSHMSTLFPEEILGFHTNMPVSSRTISSVKLLLGSLFPSWLDPKHSERIYPLKNFMKYIIRESGYFHLQATKPDTIGAALTDTPVGMAAYIMEKMGICSNRDQVNTEHSGLANLNIDDVLDTITIMWANEQITTSVRIYAEGFNWPELGIVHNIPTMVPTAALNFRYEVVYQPDWVLRDKFPNLVRSTTLDFGGHFASMHTPKELVDDIFASVKEFIKFHEKK
ncbi:juvenile hormone epoxide hydrolase-like [Epargyreus clarus]|uniref:juvenile hormone epoxide hydrolase-like n=1 Tax=Epargyreus clarus TaxID=520877 RepID=UPI003C30A810